MSDLMLTAVLSMPYDMAMENEFSRRQFWDRAQQALAEIERLTAEHTGQLAELEAISTALGTNEGNSSVDHILSLREAARTWENEAERRSRRFEQCAAERDELRRQLAEAELDAQRYQWLRNEANTARKCDPMVCIYPLDDQDLIEGDRLDVAIDAAMELTRPAEES